MPFIQILFFLAIALVHAEVGKVERQVGGENAYLIRDGQKIELKLGTSLESGDEIFSQDCVLTLSLYPTTQMALAKQTQIKLTENLIEEVQNGERSTSIIDFIKGLVRLQVTKDENLELKQEVRAAGVSFGVRGTEFEVSDEDGSVALDVMEGEVEVQSPEIQTFVPEVVKANQGLRFNRRLKKFERRAFRQRLKEQAGFLERAMLKKNWQEYRLKRRELRLERKERRQQRRQERRRGRP